MRSLELETATQIRERENKEKISGTDIVNCLVEIVERWKKTIPYDKPFLVAPFN